jgi:hypothetical protein
MEKHPARYPRHEGDKGQVFGGVCNRTACDNVGAVYFNVMTYGFYCPSCAEGINYDKKQPRLCVRVDHQVGLLEMVELNKNWWREDAEMRSKK